tara:strand:- start:375 stop:677 length:303 start_codon:yes stop_codon:yes gene_type:complete
MSNGHSTKFRTHTGPRQTDGYRREVPAAKRITIPAENKDQYEMAAKEFMQLGQKMQKALNQKTSFISQKTYLDYLITCTNWNLKAHADENNNPYHYKGNT